jgi:hypothetical protein
MIVFFVSPGSESTHACLRRQKGGPPVRVFSYDWLFRQRSLPTATYIFTDFDKLNHGGLKRASTIYNRILASGGRALNNPARARQRYALLRRLHQAGINRFGVYRVENGKMPEHYPVFVRNECGHYGPLTELIADRDTLLDAIETLISSGEPERNLIIVEYAAEAIRPNLFRKYATFRIADRLFPGTCVHDTKWQTRSGHKGIAGQQLYEDENTILRDDPYGDTLRRVFEIAEIEYGRADFGIVEGKPQIYEINTNPLVPRPGSHPFSIREESLRLVWANYLEGLAVVDGRVGPHSALPPARIRLPYPGPRWWRSLSKRWKKRRKSKLSFEPS